MDRITCKHGRSAGATLLSPPTDTPYVERLFGATDPAGRYWTFTQPIADDGS